MLQSVKANITTDSSGAAIVYLSHGPNRALHGVLESIRYFPGSIDTGADITITGETSQISILTITNAGTSNVVYNPRAKANEVADAAVGSAGTEKIPIVDERIKVVVASGGDAKSGTIEAILSIDSPY